MIKTALGRLSAGQSLSMDEMFATCDAVMQGLCQRGEIALLLTTLRSKGETVEEVAGAAASLRKHMVRIRSRRTGLLDTCGTGGDGSGTFNISTAAAFVTAAAGVPVAKHGNRKITSKTGSADVLSELGVNVEATREQVEFCLDELGLCFCFAPLLHPSMQQVAEVRRELGVPTIFNLLGPLSNPAGADFQLLGVGRPSLRPLMSEALRLLNTGRALVVCGDDGLDEVTLATTTQGTEVGSGTIRQFQWSPEHFGLEAKPLSSLQVSGPEESAVVIREVLAGKSGPARDIVLLNAAAGLLAAQAATEPRAAFGLAASAIDSGRAQDLLAQLVKLSWA